MRIFLSLLLLLALAGVSSGQNEQVKRTQRAAVGSDGVQRIDVTAGEYFFDPARIIVRVNVPVELRIRRERGLVSHDFVIEAPEAGMEIREGLEPETKSIRFTPLKTGRYPFYCDKRFLFFPSHREQGMEGVIEVVE